MGRISIETRRPLSSERNYLILGYVTIIYDRRWVDSSVGMRIH